MQDFFHLTVKQKKQDKRHRLSRDTSDLAMLPSVCTSPAHFWKSKDSHTGIFHCELCNQYRWMPVYWSDAEKYGERVKRYGEAKAYEIELSYRIDTNKEIRRLQNESEVI